MNAPARPRLADFHSRVGQSFRVHADDGAERGRWRLEECRPLPNPGLPELKNEDCFLLVFSSAAHHSQGSYLLTAADGYTARLFAVPDAGGAMCVTVNLLAPTHHTSLPHCDICCRGRDNRCHSFGTA